MENSYPTGSIKQSGWENFEKLSNEQGRFSVFRVEKKHFKIVKRPCSPNRYYRVLTQQLFMQTKYFSS